MTTQKANPKTLVIIFVVFLLALGGIYFYYMNEMDNQKADENITKSFSKEVFNTLDKFDENELAYEEQPVKFKKYIYTQYHTFLHEDKQYSYAYNEEVNGLLGTSKHKDNVSDIDGLIIAKSISEKVSENKTKLGYVLNYVKMPEQTIIHRDTLWGENRGYEPKSKVSRAINNHEMTNLPEKEVIAETILKTIK